MKQTIEEKRGIFSAFYQESVLNYRLLGGPICDQFRFNSSGKGVVNVMVLDSRASGPGGGQGGHLAFLPPRYLTN